MDVLTFIECRWEQLRGCSAGTELGRGGACPGGGRGAVADLPSAVPTGGTPASLQSVSHCFSDQFDGAQRASELCPLWPTPDLEGDRAGRGGACEAGNRVEPSLSPLRLWGGVLGNPCLIHHRSPRGIDHFPTAQCLQATMALSDQGRPAAVRIRRLPRVPAAKGKLPSAPPPRAGPSSVTDGLMGRAG